MMTETIRNYRDRGIVLYTNRKMLTEQLIGVLKRSGVEFGVRAAEFAEYTDLGQAVQISSVPTENSRVYRRGEWTLHDAGLVIWDEAHMQANGAAEKVFRDHQSQGAINLGVTATPLGINHLYHHIVQAGTNSELRKCGAHVPCYTTSTSELDVSKVKQTKTGEYSVGDIVKNVWTPQIVGHVIPTLRKLNPDLRPMLGWAPGVAQAVWMAEQMTNHGIRSAALDGNDIWIDGKTYKSDREARATLLELSEAGEVKCIWNRFVLREAIDMPWIYHGILATPIGSYKSYLQTVGRILRSHPSMDHCILQDHGGNWWRHGSPNADINWENWWRFDERQITAERQERMREKKDPEPINCPECGLIRASGKVCPKCGTEATKKSRKILQANGKLKTVEGDVFKPRKVKQTPNTERLWKQTYHRCKKAGQTFRQAMGLFYRENYYYPPKTLPLMPTSPMDWYCPIKSVPTERLR